MRFTLPFASALLLYLAFPPADLCFLGFVALAPLIIYAVTEEKGWRGFLVGWAAGMLFHTLAFWWLTCTAPVIGPPGLGLYKGLYWGLFVYLVRWACRPGDVPIALAAPVAWITLELTRCYLFGGLPFWIVGYALHGFGTLIQIADLGGVWLVTWLALLVNAAIACAFLRGGSSREYRLSAGLSIALIAVSVLYGLVRLSTIEMTDGLVIGVVQPNIPQDIKKQIRGRDQEYRDSAYKQHMRLTHEAATRKPDLIVWPEVALLEVPTVQDGRFLEDFGLKRAQSPAVETGIPCLIGLQIRDAPAGVPPYSKAAWDQSSWTNSAIYIDGAGRVLGRFDKIKLVHFSETFELAGGLFPAEKIAAWFLGAERLNPFRRGTSLPVFEHPKGRFAVSICSENYYPEISREFAGRGAKTIVNISNDGWFGESAELDAQMWMAQFRAIENRVLYVRATNTGISAMIEPTGRIAAELKSPAGKRKCIEGTLIVTARVTDSTSLYRAIGDWAAWLCAGLAVGGFVALKLARSRQNVDREKSQA